MKQKISIAVNNTLQNESENMPSLEDESLRVLQEREDKLLAINALFEAAKAGDVAKHSALKLNAESVIDVRLLEEKLASHTKYKH